MDELFFKKTWVFKVATARGIIEHLLKVTVRSKLYGL